MPEDLHKTLPRKCFMEKWCLAERKIDEARQIVEQMGGSPRLTDASILLGQAMDAVADYVDENK